MPTTARRPKVCPPGVSRIHRPTCRAAWLSSPTNALYARATSVAVTDTRKEGCSTPAAIRQATPTRSFSNSTSRSSPPRDHSAAVAGLSEMVTARLASRSQAASSPAKDSELAATQASSGLSSDAARTAGAPSSSTHRVPAASTVNADNPSSTGELVTTSSVAAARTQGKHSSDSSQRLRRLTRPRLLFGPFGFNSSGPSRWAPVRSAHGIVRRRIDAMAELRSLQDLAHRVWLHEPALLNFEASFGGLAWQRGRIGRCRASAPR